MIDHSSRFSEQEHVVWKKFLTHRTQHIESEACAEFLDGLKKIHFSSEAIPKISAVSNILKKETGWELSAVDGLVPDPEFFKMLSKKVFPVNYMIRPLGEIEFYTSPAPDLIHEFFGHCPMLMNPIYAEFMQAFGEFSLKQNEEKLKVLGKVYWFTVEFGLIQTQHGLRAYGAGILPSIKETFHALKNPDTIRKPFHLEEIARIEYDVKKVQDVYYVIDDFKKLYGIVKGV